MKTSKLSVAIVVGSVFLFGILSLSQAQENPVPVAGGDVVTVNSDSNQIGNTEDLSLNQVKADEAVPAAGGGSVGSN